jgi:hypothetical protein
MRLSAEQMPRLTHTVEHDVSPSAFRSRYGNVGAAIRVLVPGRGGNRMARRPRKMSAEHITTMGTY